MFFFDWLLQIFQCFKYSAGRVQIISGTCYNTKKSTVTSATTDECITTTVLTGSCQKPGIVQLIVLLLANYHGRYEPQPLQTKWGAF